MSNLLLLQQRYGTDTFAGKTGCSSRELTRFAFANWRRPILRLARVQFHDGSAAMKARHRGKFITSAASSLRLPSARAGIKTAAVWMPIQ
jgi:hypothetical protein